MFREAGQGLAAAHAVGMVHRDFKPENVMVGDDGRVRVMDFGLARSSGEVEIRPNEAPSSTSGIRASTKLTRTGSVMGTPAYMSPEQHLGLPVDARSDQFSFCVALYEALWGRRPFVGETLATLALAVTDGDFEQPTDRPEVARVVREAVFRGLARQPEDRWPSLDPLLAALEPAAPAGTSRAWLAGGLTLAAAVAIGLVFGSQDQPEADPCASGEEAIAQVWNDDRRAALQERFRTDAPAYAAKLLPDIEATIDTYAHRWMGQHRATCEATVVRHEQSPEAMDLRMGCLGSRLEDLEGILATFETVDATGLGSGLELASALAPLDRCADIDALRAAVPPPEDPALAERVDALDRSLDRSRNLRIAGQETRALEVAVDVQRQAAGLDYPPIQARAALQVGLSEYELAHYEEARAALETALWTAMEIGDWTLATRAASALSTALAQGLGETERAEPLSRLGLSLARKHAENPDLTATALIAATTVERRAEHFDEAIALATAALDLRSVEPVNRGEHFRATHALAATYFYAAKYEEAAATFREAIVEGEEVYGKDHPQLCEAIYGLGLTLQALTRHEEAAELFERSLAIRRAAYGDLHIDTAESISAVAGSHFFRSEYPEAIAGFQRAVDIGTQIVGADALEVAIWRLNLSRAYAWAEDYPSAMREVEQVIEVRRARLGPRSHGLAEALFHQGDVLRWQDRNDEALPLYERAYEIDIEALGGDHPELFRSAFQLGQAYRKAGRPWQARSMLQSALRIAESEATANEIYAAFALHELAVVYREAGEIEPAIGHLERAVEIRERHGHRLLGSTRHELALTLAEPGKLRDVPRARALALQAAEELDETSPKDAPAARALAKKLGAR